MTVVPPAKYTSHLDDRFVEAAKRNVAAQAKQRVDKREARQAWQRDAPQTIRWLREIEAKEAVPVMHAIAKAENIVGRRLVVQIDRSLVLCSRGFRIAVPLLIYPLAGVPDFTTFKISRKNLKLGRILVEEGESIKDRVKTSLQTSDVEKKLVYQGLDEWPTIGKLCWYGAMFGTALMPWWLVVHHIHCAAFRRAFTPV